MELPGENDEGRCKRDHSGTAPIPNFLPLELRIDESSISARFGSVHLPGGHDASAGGILRLRSSIPQLDGDAQRVDSLRLRISVSLLVALDGDRFSFLRQSERAR